MNERLFVLLPPSQGKSVGGRATTVRGSFDEELGDPRREVLGALDALVTGATPRELELVLSAKGELLARAVASSQALARGEAPLLPAWRRYQGVVWTHVAPDSLSSRHRRQILVPSGLYGLLASDDPIADYRLKMNVSLAPLSTLARFWRPAVTEAIARRTERATLVNLLPKEHLASVDVSHLSASREVINVRFVTGDEKSAVGHDAKAAKGEIARRVLLEGTGALERFTWEGWRSRREGSEVVVRAPQRPRG